VVAQSSSERLELLEPVRAPDLAEHTRPVLALGSGRCSFVQVQRVLVLLALVLAPVLAERCSSARVKLVLSLGSGRCSSERRALLVLVLALDLADRIQRVLALGSGRCSSARAQRVLVLLELALAPVPAGRCSSVRLEQLGQLELERAPDLADRIQRVLVLGSGCCSSGQVQRVLVLMGLVRELELVLVQAPALAGRNRLEQALGCFERTPESQ